MIHFCPICKKQIAKEDNRKKVDKLLPLNNTTMQLRGREAPRLKCGNCGKLVILLKGTL